MRDVPPPPDAWEEVESDASSHKQLPASVVVPRTAYALLYGAVLLLVVTPLILLLISTFQEGTLGNRTGWGFEHWQRALTSPRLGRSLWNTATLAIVRQGLAICVGILIAWLLARTDIPFPRMLEFAFWIAFFIPALNVTLVWIFLIDDYNGVLNRVLMTLPFVDEPPFNVFSWWGIVWVNFLAAALPVKVMLLTPAFRNLDSSIEEAARLSGDTAFGTFRRVTLPLMMPTCLIVLVLGVIRSFESFEVELILGLPADIEVFTSLVYRYMRLVSPPESGLAMVLSVISLVLLIPLILYQQWYGRTRSYSSVGAKFRVDRKRLGWLRWPAFALVFTLAMLMSALPVLGLTAGTFMSFFGRFDVVDVWTLNHWQTVMQTPVFTSSMKNTLVLSGMTTVSGLILFTGIAYSIARTEMRGRGWLDFYAWLPTVIPGIVLGLGYLLLFLRVPGLSAMYGTIVLLVVVCTLGVMTVGVQLVKQGLRQIGPELEEASWISGASRFATLRLILLPLISPTLVVVAVTAFSSSARATGHVALLSTGRNQPLAILQLLQMADNNYEVASVVGLFILMLTVGVAILARALGYRSR